MVDEPFVTATLAELYIRQGHVEQGISFYRQLLAREPGNAQFRARLAELTSPAGAGGTGGTMGFKEHLERVCSTVEGSVLCTMMGNDGIPIDSAVSTTTTSPVDVQTILIEFAGMMAQMQKSSATVTSGPVEELSIRTGQVVAILRPVSRDYFLGLAMLTSGNTGKGRYMLRVIAPALLRELG
jgi:predicted regulator of Ras-like GTPase activity (Roadblock/LC7/MglB family)